MKPYDLAKKLIRIPSVTPASKNIFDMLEDILQPIGFKTTWFSHNNVYNAIYSCKKGDGPHFAFAGHVDTVPVDNPNDWDFSPFDGIIQKNILIGRGAVDMKGAIAAFICAIPKNYHGKISLIITGDEEGPGLFGTRYIVDMLHQTNEKIDACILGEPTSEQIIGDTIKIGRRGSIQGKITAHGEWGHTAYPKQHTNAITNLLNLLTALSNITFDHGNHYFQQTTCVLSNITTPNTVSNVIPGEATAFFNIRFNTEQTIETIDRMITSSLPVLPYTLNLELLSEPFLVQCNPFIDLIVHTIKDIIHKKPILSTNGGTSDARFIHQLCPVIELGLKNATIHQTNEQTSIQDLIQLTAIYHRILNNFFKKNSTI